MKKLLMFIFLAIGFLVTPVALFAAGQDAPDPGSFLKTIIDLTSFPELLPLPYC